MRVITVLLEKEVDEVRADEPGTAGDEIAHDAASLHFMGSGLSFVLCYIG
jgi:hypothetical protein